MKKHTYIALLRGINVGGHNVTMENLRTLFSELGFENVRSYIQTGNIFFESDVNDREILRKKIEDHLLKNLGYNVPVCLRTVEEFEDILKHNPFKGIELRPDMRFSITYLAEPISEKIKLPMKTPDEGYELISMTESELFIIWYLKNGRPGNSFKVFEKMFNTSTTTRFWHTSDKILNAAKKEK